MASSWAGRLSELRHLRFIGRAAERMLFQGAITESPLPFHALYIFGPGGVGKSTLLREFTFSCEAASIPCVRIDARNVEPTPDAFLMVLRMMMGISAEQSPFEAIAAHPGNYILILDTYETLAPLDDWLREFFLPRLPENTLVVLAGRQAPSRAWRADPGWQTLIRTISLRNFRPQETRAFLTQRGVPPHQHDNVLDFTYGHPLALSLVAEVVAQRPDVEFHLEDEPDIVKTLLEQFIEKLPGPPHRAALEVCSLVRVATESLLAEVFADRADYDPHELFEWLRGLSFIEKGPFGLFPHDLAREALVADLRWRNPDRYADLHHRVRAYLIARFQQAHGIEQQTLLFDLTFLHRYNPVVRPFFEWKESGSLVPDAVRSSEDRQQIRELVAFHEGPDSAQFADYYLNQFPEAFVVFRSNEGSVEGFFAKIPLHAVDEQVRQSDPALRAAWDYLMAHAPLRRGELATHFRWWIARETHQQLSALQTLIFINVVQHYLVTPGLAFHFFPCLNAEFWAPVMAYADLHRLPQADYTIDGRTFGVYGHDWRIVPPLAWLELLGEREIENEAAAPQPAPVSTSQIVVLSQPEFEDAVRDALRFYPIPDGLYSSPLLKSRLVADRAGMDANTDARMAALQSVIREAAEMLQVSPREAKLYRALYHTYFQPAPTQEAAAELLDLPFSTYRRHLKGGIDRVTEILWAQEIGR